MVTVCAFAELVGVNVVGAPLWVCRGARVPQLGLALAVRRTQVRLNPLRRHHQAAFLQGRDGLFVICRGLFQASLFGKEEKGFVLFCVKHPRDGQRAADGAAEILTPIERSLARRIKIIARVERLIPDEFVQVSMEGICSGLCRNLDSPRGRTPVLRAIS
jgi:hypothetical protein